MKNHRLTLTWAALALASALAFSGCASRRIESASGASLKEDAAGPVAPRRHAGSLAAKDLSEEQAKLLQTELSSLPEGLVAFDPPPAMRLGTPVRLEARAAKDFPSKLSEALEKTGKFKGVTVKNFVGMQLTGSGFTLLASSPEEQAVGEAAATTWAWNAVPNAQGRHPLLLTVTLRMLLNGNELKRAYPVLERTVDIQNAEGGFFQTYGWWILAVLLVGAAVYLLLKKP